MKSGRHDAILAVAALVAVLTLASAAPVAPLESTALVSSGPSTSALPGAPLVQPGVDALPAGRGDKETDPASPSAAAPAPAIQPAQPTQPAPPAGPAPSPQGDTRAPSITLRSPAPSSSFAGSHPAVRLQYTDASGVDPRSVRILLDGAALDVTATSSAAVAFPRSAVAPGEHHVEATVADTAGNVARTTWTFHVTPADAAAADARAGSDAARFVQAPGLPAGALSVAPIRYAGGQEAQPLLRALSIADPIPEGARRVAAFDLSPDASGDGTATLEIHLDRSWLADEGISAPRLVLLHHVHGRWQPHALQLTPSPDGRLVLVAEVPSFSPFALVEDTTPPLATLVEPLTGDADTLRAHVRFEDAGGIVPNLLLLDGAPVPSTLVGSDWLRAELRDLAPGEHTLTATAFDYAGNEANQTWRFVVGLGPGGAEAGSLGEHAATALLGQDEAPPEDAPAAATGTDASRGGRAGLAALMVAATGIASLAYALSRGGANVASSRKRPPKRKP